MLRTLGSAVATAGVGLVGCSTTYLTVDRVLADASRDEAALVSKLSDDVVGLQGRVQGKGTTIENTKSVASRFGVRDLDDRSVAYVVLHGTTSQPGQALCLFGPLALDGLTPVREGELVTVTCEFKTMAGAPPERVPVFERCYVE
jgi:hypothetical protein